MGYRSVGDLIGISNCHDSGGNQAFMFTKVHEIRARKFCVDATAANKPVTLYVCHGQQGNQYWQYDADVSAIACRALLCVLSFTIFIQLQARALKHSFYGNCLTARENATVTIDQCDGSPSQQWILHNLERQID